MTHACPQNLLDVLVLYKQATELHVSGQTRANLKCALRRYILPNLPDHSFSLEELGKADLEYALSQISIKDFLDAEPISLLNQACQAAVIAGKLGKNTERASYRPAVNHFLKWIQQEPWHEEIFQERVGKYAPRTRYGRNIKDANKGKSKRSLYQRTSYSLKDDQVIPPLSAQIDALEKFCTSEYVPHRRDDKMEDVTFGNHRTRILNICGWLVNIKSYKAIDLDLRLCMETSLVDEYIAWGINERKSTYGWAQGIAEMALNVAKYFYASESKRPMYRDIEVIEEIRVMTNKFSRLYAEQKKKSKREKRPKREMSLEQCIEIKKYLRKCCAPYDSYNAKRSDLAIVRAWQRYLLVAILTYCPVRQRELREMELGRTLFRMPDGYRMYLQPEDNKTKDEREFLLSDILAEDVVRDIDEWLDVWRPKIKEAIQSVDSWLKFVNRRAYKNEEQLIHYINKLEAGKTNSSDQKNCNQLEKVNKKKKLIQESLDARILARDNFHDGLFFLSCGDSQLIGLGQPLTASGVYSIVTRAVYTATSALQASGHPLFKDIDPRETNPHYFRNIAITHERRFGEPSKRKAFHKVLGNSEATGDRDYNEMHPSEKTIDAKDWWKTDNLNSNTTTVAKIRSLLAKLPEEERKRVLKNLL